MKNYIFLLIGLVAIFSMSCEKIKDATAIDIDTELKADIPVSTQNTVAIVLKSEQIGAETFNYSGTESFSLSSNPDLEKYINNIRSIKSNGPALLKITNLLAGNEITTLEVKYGIKTPGGAEPTMNSLFTIPAPMLATNGLAQYSSSAWLSIFTTILESNKDKEFKLEVIGTANFEVEKTINLIMPIIVAASPLK